MYFHKHAGGLVHFLPTARAFVATQQNEAVNLRLTFLSASEITGSMDRTEPAIVSLQRSVGSELERQNRTWLELFRDVSRFYYCHHALFNVHLNAVGGRATFRPIELLVCDRIPGPPPP